MYLTSCICYLTPKVLGHIANNVVFYLLLMLSFVNKINSYLTFILFNPLVYVVFVLFRILVVLCFFTSNLYYECVK